LERESGKRVATGTVFVERWIQLTGSGGGEYDDDHYDAEDVEVGEEDDDDDEHPENVDFFQYIHTATT